MKSKVGILQSRKAPMDLRHDRTQNQVVYAVSLFSVQFRWRFDSVFLPNLLKPASPR